MAAVEVDVLVGTGWTSLVTDKRIVIDVKENLMGTVLLDEHCRYCHKKVQVCYVIFC